MIDKCDVIERRAVGLAHFDARPFGLQRCLTLFKFWGRCSASSIFSTILPYLMVLYVLLPSLTSSVSFEPKFDELVINDGDFMSTRSLISSHRVLWSPCSFCARTNLATKFQKNEVLDKFIRNQSSFSADKPLGTFSPILDKESEGEVK